jgi:cation transport regulator ChaC/SOS response regulatory protein OraA/RecX
LETGKRLRELSFPAAEGSRLGDWDGVVRTEEATAFVPDGLSGWELSVERNAEKKADEDYEKRTKSPDDSPTTECTYAAVSLRTWQRRRDWATRRSNEGRWKVVRALGLDEIDAWLGDAPVTHAWISEQLGLEPYGMRTLDGWWTNWSTQTNPVLPTALLLAGRAAAVSELRQKLASSPQTITISAESRDEVLAFVAALGMVDDSAGSGSVLARAAIVDEVTTWRALVMRTQPLVLVAGSDAVIADAGGRQSVHHVIVPVPNASAADIELPRVDPNEAAKAFEGALTEKDAGALARLARLSLLAARRQIAVKKELLRPSWAQTHVPREVRRLLLANRWSSANEGDREVIARFLGMSYADIAEVVVRYSSGSDPLLATVDAAVTLVSPYDAYSVLTADLTTDDLTDFKAMCLEVLGAANPALELPTDEQWKASILGKQRPHSDDLRHGVANSLALLGTLGSKSIPGSTMAPSDFAAWTVRELLKQANQSKDVSPWASLNDVLPEIAEAAPSEFLDAVADGLQGEPPLLASIFINEGAAGMFAHQTHTGLLWGLEICAWSSAHISRAVDLLAQLAAVDRGSPRYVNRPFNSLREIFLPWHPQNTLDIQSRLDVIDGLRSRRAAIAWRLMVALLPEGQGAAMPTHPPSYRDWKPADDPPVLMRDYWGVIRGIADGLIADVSRDVDRWVQLIPKLDDLPPDLRAPFLVRLQALAGEADLGENERARIFETLDELVSRHREFAGEATWALPADQVDEMARVAEMFRPSTPVIAARWLFADYMPSIPGVQRRDNFEGYTEDLNKLRADAMALIAASAEWSDLLSFVREAKVPGDVGLALADAGATKFDSQIVGLLDTEGWNADVTFAHAYVSRRIGKNSLGAQDLLKNELSPRQRARVILARWDRAAEWDLLKNEGQAVVDNYWREFPRFPGKVDVAVLKTIARGLTSVGRFAAAVDLLAMLVPDEGDSELADLIAGVLERSIQSGNADREVAPAEHDYVRLFNYMDKSLPIERIARLEWQFLPALEHSSRDFALHRAMSDDPNFFVELVSRVFRPSDDRDGRMMNDDSVDEKQPEPDETTRTVTLNAYRLIDSWKSLPGMGADGTLDDSKLRTWVETARSEFARLRRRSIGDDQIGKVLAHSPSGIDGAWPAESVRELIESYGNRQLVDGFVVEVRNSRGVTSRALESGGSQERDLAARYRGFADAVTNRWPSTAAVLGRIADSYEYEARREDEDAERWRKGLEGPGTGQVAPVAKTDETLVLHFAYGSNMSTPRLEKRVGTVRKRGIAKLDGFEIRFDKKSDDGSGKTNIAKMMDGGTVWGVLFELTPEQMATLASREKGYATRDDLKVIRDGVPVAATTFVAKKQTEGLKPTRTYLDYLIAGAREHQLPPEYIAKLQAVEVTVKSPTQRSR